MVVTFAFGLWISSTAFDLLSLVSGKEQFRRCADDAMAAGLIGAGLAAPTGMSEFVDIEPGKARKLATVHGIGNGTLASLYAVNWALRRGRNLRRRTGFWPLALSFLGLGGILYTGWLGGQMVYRHGVGVTPQRKETPRRHRKARESAREKERELAAA